MVSGLYPVLAMVYYEKCRNLACLLPYLFMIVVTVGGAGRSDTALTILPALIYILLRKRNFSAKAIWVGALLVVVFLAWDEIYSFFTLAGGTLNYTGIPRSSLSVTLNGRLELWVYNIQKFAQHPLVGNGINFINRATDYMGVATSEVGILKAFSECGILFGGLELYLIVRAVRFALGRILVPETDFITLFCCYLVLADVFMAVQSFSRIVNVMECFFWVAVFYLNLEKGTEHKLPIRAHNMQMKGVYG